MGQGYVKLLGWGDLESSKGVDSSGEFFFSCLLMDFSCTGNVYKSMKEWEEASPEAKAVGLGCLTGLLHSHRSLET